MLGGKLQQSLLTRLRQLLSGLLSDRQVLRQWQLTQIRRLMTGHLSLRLELLVLETAFLISLWLILGGGGRRYAGTRRIMHQRGRVNVAIATLL